MGFNAASTNKRKIKPTGGIPEWDDRSKPIRKKTDHDLTENEDPPVDLEPHGLSATTMEDRRLTAKVPRAKEDHRRVRSRPQALPSSKPSAWRISRGLLLSAFSIRMSPLNL